MPHALLLRGCTWAATRTRGCGARQECAEVRFLTEDQERRYANFTGEPTHDQLARHFYLDDADRSFIVEHRDDHNRPGIAVQLGSVRLLGTFLDDPVQTPESAVRFLADQLSAVVGSSRKIYFGSLPGA